jgi:hypothetical protein
MCTTIDLTSSHPSSRRQFGKHNTIEVSLVVFQRERTARSLFEIGR